VLSRNIEKSFMRELYLKGFSMRQANLDDHGSVDLVKAVAGCTGCYIHSTSSDTKKIDMREVKRAKNLADAIIFKKGITHVVYNSAAVEPDLVCGVRKLQKHQVEDVFLGERFDGVLQFTSLSANLFMGELWKKYTRPTILKGKFSFCVPPDRKIHLTSVRSMGRLAGAFVCCPPRPQPVDGLSLWVCLDAIPNGHVLCQGTRNALQTCTGSITGPHGATLFSQPLGRDSIFATNERNDGYPKPEGRVSRAVDAATSFDKFLEATDWRVSDRLACKSGLTFEDFELTIKWSALK
jgi:hypothetical protein